MQLTVLGVGHSFTTIDAHTNFFIQHPQYGVLIDAGTTLRSSLIDANISLNDITHIFITHFHHDHVGGLAELLMKSYWQFNEHGHQPHIPTLILRREQLAEIEGLLAPSLNNQQFTWQSYCHVAFFEDNAFSIGDVTYECIVTDELHCEGMRSYGLRVTERDVNIVISGDIKHLQQSTILQYITDSTAAVFTDVSYANNPLHASYEETIQYYPAAILENVYAVHYDKIETGYDAIQYAQKNERFIFL